MGQSTDAYLFYGFDFAGEGFYDEGDEYEFLDNWEEVYVKAKGLEHPGHGDNQKEARRS